MTEAYVHIDGERITHLRLRVANKGPWWCELDLEGQPDLTRSGKRTVHVGALELVGTVPSQSVGRFGLQTKARLNAGGGGWGHTIGRRHYHNDGGVKARTIAEDAARDAGELLGNFVPALERVGADFVREEGLASTALEAVIGGVPWHVDYAGITHVGARPAAPVAASAYKVLAFDPRTKWATLSVDDPRAVGIGSVISDGLEVPRTVRELELTVTPEELRVAVWLGGGDNEGGKLEALFRALVERVSDGKLHGAYRYRVVGMAQKRVQLQAVRKGAGLPDIKPISMWPGVAGAHAELAPGAEVLVQFLEGDRTMPIITHFAGADGKGFVPTSLTLGGESGAEVTRKGDAVEVLLPPMVVNGTMVVSGTPTPFTGVLTSTLGKAVGAATAGSSIVKAASS
jgi:hypothetical protein